MLLDGCHVLDLTDDRGLVCGQILGDLGATVVHIEPPGGSSARRDEILWKVHTRNQQSLLLDLSSPPGRDRFLELVGRCDIVIESGAAAMVELGLAYPDLLEVNPSVVYVSISPFGASGPKRGYHATDLILQAAAGNLAVTGFADRPPLRASGVNAWSHAGAAAAGAALIGLRLARRTGRPSHVDVSAQEAASLAAAITVLSEAVGFVRTPRMAPDGTGSGIVACADGFVVNTVAPIGPMLHFMTRQVKWMASEGALDPATEEALSGGKVTPQSVQLLGEAIRRMFANRTRQQLLDAALECGFVLAPVNSARDVLDGGQFQARDTWWQDGSITMPGAFAQFSAAPLVLRSTAPGPDQHEPEPFPEARRRSITVPHEDAALPLDSVKVLDFGWVMAAPYATRVMADYGAAVIRVESAKRMDLIRLLPPFYASAAMPESSAAFASVNAGKASIGLDLAQEDARQVALDLVEWADVVCESFAPGVMQRLELDYETLRARRRDLVMVSSSLFGQTGPYASMPGYGTQGAAVAGITLPTGYKDRPPAGPFGPFTDFIAPRYQLAAILAALEYRDRTGQGQYIDLSQAETGLQASAASLARCSLDGTILDREANGDPNMRPHGVYPASGTDEWVAIAVRDERDWRSLCDVMGSPDLAASPPPSNVDDVVAAWTKQRPGSEAERLLQQAGVPAHHVLNATTALTDGHVADRGMFVHTTYGGRDALVTSTGLHFSSVPASVGRVPRIGEDSVSVLSDILRYPASRIEALVEQGAVSIAGVVTKGA